MGSLSFGFPLLLLRVLFSKLEKRRQIRDYCPPDYPACVPVGYPDPFGPGIGAGLADWHAHGPLQYEDIYTVA